MKAFEKWWMLEAQNIMTGGRSEPVGEEFAKIVWKVALQWVNKATETISLEDPYDGIRDAESYEDELLSLLEQELTGETETTI